MNINSISNKYQTFKSTRRKTSSNRINYSSDESFKNINKDTYKTKNNKKKFAFVLFSLASLATIISGFIYASKKGKIPHEISNMNKEAKTLSKEVTALANEVQEESLEIYQRMKNIADDVTDIFRRIKSGENISNARIINNNILEELDNDNKLVRKSIFINGLVNNIQEFENDLTKNYSYHTKVDFKSLTPYITPNEYSVFNRTNSIYEKCFSFKDGKISNFRTNLKQSKNLWEYEKCLLFYDDKLTNYKENCIRSFTQEKTFDYEFEKYLAFVDNQLTEFGTGNKQLANGTNETQKLILFSNDKPNIFVRGFKESNHKQEFNQILINKNNKWVDESII